jgi:hypothetical protein
MLNRRTCRASAVRNIVVVAWVQLSNYLQLEKGQINVDMLEAQNNVLEAMVEVVWWSEGA